MNEYAGFADDNKWFDDNRDKIIAGHHGEMVVIRDREVRGYYPNMTAAIEGMKPLVLGQCVVPECMTKEEENEIIMGAIRASCRL